jgi:hypothetical protein
LLARPAPWVVAALTVGCVVGAFQVRHAYSLDLGNPTDQAYTVNFQDRDEDADSTSTRPSGTYSYVTLPGVGGGVPYTVSVRLKPARANLPISLILNGETLFQQPISGTWQTLTFTIDDSHPQALASRDLVLELRAPAIRSVAVDRVDVGAQGPGLVVPALGQVAGLAGVVLLVYLLLSRSLGDVAGRPWLGWLPLIGAALVALALVALLAAEHLPLTVTTGHLLLTGVLTYALLVLGEAMLRRIAPTLGSHGARIGAALFAAAFAVRFGGMALPQSVIIDMPYHMKWMRELLAGNIGVLTDPHGGLNQPPREWGIAVIIPKSPLFYFLAAPLAVLPGALDTWIKAFVCLLDASAVLICIALLARALPPRQAATAALWAGFVAAANPLAYRALAYGILPTILAQWLAVAFFAGLVWAVASRQSSVASRQSSVSIAANTQHATRNTQYATRFTFYVLRRPPHPPHRRSRRLPHHRRVHHVCGRRRGRNVAMARATTGGSRAARRVGGGLGAGDCDLLRCVYRRPAHAHPAANARQPGRGERRHGGGRQHRPLDRPARPSLLDRRLPRQPASPHPRRGRSDPLLPAKPEQKRSRRQ